MPSLSLIVLRSADLERSAAFYAALGLQFTRERHGNGPEHLAAVIGGLVLEIYPATDTSTSGVQLGFRVDSLDTVLAALREAGASVKLSGQGESRRGRVVDPDGHILRLEEAGSEQERL